MALMLFKYWLEGSDRGLSVLIDKVFMIASCESVQVSVDANLGITINNAKIKSLEKNILNGKTKRDGIF